MENKIIWEIDLQIYLWFCFKTILCNRQWLQPWALESDLTFIFPENNQSTSTSDVPERETNTSEAAECGAYEMFQIIPEL